MSFTIRNALALGAFSVLAAAQESVTPKLDASCADVVTFLARGNNALYHDARTSPLTDAICAKAQAQGKTCDRIDIQYDVTLGADYCTQIAEGARNGMAEIIGFNAKCPCSHIVVIGYSEGGQVVGDVLGGPGGCTFVSTGIDPESSAGKAIAAVTLFGDVLHTANQPYNVLDGADKGPNPRSADDLARLGRYTPVLRSYCAGGDPICAGGNDVQQHLNYFQLYTDDASSWIINKVANTPSLCPVSSSSSSMMASSTAAPSAMSSANGYPVVSSSVGYYNASSTAYPVASSSYTTSAGYKASSAAGYPASSAPASKPSSSAPGYPAWSAPASKPSSSLPAYPTTSAMPYPTPVPDSCIAQYKVEYKYV